MNTYPLLLHFWVLFLVFHLQVLAQVASPWWKPTLTIQALGPLSSEHPQPSVSSSVTTLSMLCGNCGSSGGPLRLLVRVCVLPSLLFSCLACWRHSVFTVEVHRLILVWMLWACTDSCVSDALYFMTVRSDLWWPERDGGFEALTRPVCWLQWDRISTLYLEQDCSKGVRLIILLYVKG